MFKSLTFKERGNGTFVKVSLRRADPPYAEADCIIKCPDGTKIKHWCSMTRISNIPSEGDEIPMINEDGLWKIA